MPEASWAERVWRQAARPEEATRGFKPWALDAPVGEGLHSDLWHRGAATERLWTRQPTWVPSGVVRLRPINYMSHEADEREVWNRWYTRIVPTGAAVSETAEAVAKYGQPWRMATHEQRMRRPSKEKPWR